MKVDVFLDFWILVSFFVGENIDDLKFNTFGGKITNKITLKVNSWKRHQNLNWTCFAFAYLIKNWWSRFEDAFRQPSLCKGVTKVEILSVWNLIICICSINYWHVTVPLVFEFVSYLYLIFIVLLKLFTVRSIHPPLNLWFWHSFAISQLKF